MTPDIAQAFQVATATTVVIVRDDFSIPGEAYGEEGQPAPSALERRLFNLLGETKPDVVVLDLSRAPGAGVATIAKIRRLSPVPILAVCARGARRASDYRKAGAADCIAAPVDIVTFNQALQRIVRRARADSRAATPSPEEADAVAFAGISFLPRKNLLIGSTGARARLTTAESRLLKHFVGNPWQIHSRAQLAEPLYGDRCPATDRAIEMTVARLRTKLRSVGEAAEHLIKTEHRRGYRFVSDTSMEMAGD
jgi:DNA-binding response OmpR family regulator